MNIICNFPGGLSPKTPSEGRLLSDCVCRRSPRSSDWNRGARVQSCVRVQDCLRSACQGLFVQLNVWPLILGCFYEGTWLFIKNCPSIVQGNAIFPQCSDIVWGPDDATAHRFELTPHTKNGIVEVPNGHIELVFDKKADIRVYPRLVKEGISAADLKKGLSVKNEDKTVSGDVEPFFLIINWLRNSRTAELRQEILRGVTSLSVSALISWCSLGLGCTGWLVGRVSLLDC